MKHYIDITLLPSDDIGVHFLWSKVMMQVHLALVEIKDADNKTPIAVSFPDYRDPKSGQTGFLGRKLRLFASECGDFDKLDISKKLKRLEDYVHIKGLKDVPSDVTEFESFGRRDSPGSPAKLIRRRMKRKNETHEQASKYYENYTMNGDVKSLPYVKMNSLSEQKYFPLTITRKSNSMKNSETLFSTYGLNLKASLPKF